MNLDRQMDYSILLKTMKGVDFSFYPVLSAGASPSSIASVAGVGVVGD